MRYKEYLPPSELASWIKLFWVFENRSNNPISETIVTDGSPELIVHYGSPFKEVDRSGQIRTQPLAVVCGQLTKPLILESSRNAGMIGIRFHPNGMAPFLSASMHSISDIRVSAENMFTETDKFIEEIINSANDKHRIAACYRFLIGSMHPTCRNFSVRHALDLIIQSRGTISVKHLASTIGVSKRSLELAFREEVGTSPKMFCRITRFRRVFDEVSKETSSVDWIQTALDSGFFDQSHLIRDFHRFSGRSPTSFLANKTTFTQTVN